MRMPDTGGAVTTYDKPYVDLDEWRDEPVR
jgi:hypothetical protein